MLSSVEITEFRTQLLAWFAAYKRDLPWRRTSDTYKIWLSEVMLQQTRVSAVIPYYERFLARFPTLEALADAPESDLLANWAGLGYYYRARNLQKAAQQICAAGAFPETYTEILNLPGVGAYTAAAVASIAFNRPHAVLDGNVYRVISRVLNDQTNMASAKAPKHFGVLADGMLDREQPGTWNEAIMELGATICLPKKPQCLLCPVSRFCRARANGRQELLPVKIKTHTTSKHSRILFWIEQNGSLLLWQRSPDSRLMPGFWELPEAAQLPQTKPGQELGSFRHGITTHNYTFEVAEAAVPGDLGECQWVPENDLRILPLSTIVKKARRTVGRMPQRKSSALPASAGG